MVINQVEEAEDTGEADDTEEKPEIHKHGKITFLRQFKDEKCHLWPGKLNTVVLPYPWLCFPWFQ